MEQQMTRFPHKHMASTASGAPVAECWASGVWGPTEHTSGRDFFPVSAPSPAVPPSLGIKHTYIVESSGFHRLRKTLSISIKWEAPKLSTQGTLP